MPLAYILTGSNIDPVENTRRAIALLGRSVRIEAHSSAWQTGAVGSPGPDFINLALRVWTDMDFETLKFGVLRSIERQLGRIRTQDKNSPRTVDLDIIVFDGQVTDPGIWSRAYVALPMLELLPDLIHPVEHQSLQEICANLLEEQPIVKRPDLIFSL